MDKGRRTSSIIEKFVYDPVSQELNVSFQDLQYNVESGELGFFEKDGNVCYVSKMEISNGTYSVTFTDGSIFSASTVNGVLEYSGSGGGGGGGSATILIEVDPGISVTGITPDELKKAIQTGAPIAWVRTTQQESSEIIECHPVVYVGYATGEYQGQIMHQMSIMLFDGVDASYVDYGWSAEDNAWLTGDDGGGGD